MFKVLTAIGLTLAMVAASPAKAQTADPRWNAHEADFTVADFQFKTGEHLANLRLHYTTLGTPVRDAAGRITNAVFLLHGTGGTGQQFYRAQFSGELFGPGQLLDTARYFIILPDDIGHGRSSKPSDGLHMRFPKYGYADMVALEHALVTDGLHVGRLKLILGTSMGCMHAFVWGETYPDAAEALAPFACLPSALVGRNRLWREMVVDAIQSDPAWKGGDYTAEPPDGLRAAAYMLSIAGSAPAQMQKSLPTQAAIDKYRQDLVTNEMVTVDADDLIYQLNASKDYDPSANLERITTKVLWINSADDFINPPELGIAEKMAPRLKHGRLIVLPISENTHGHGTHTWAVAWKAYLKELLDSPAS